MTPINARKATSFLRKKKKTINFALKIYKNSLSDNRKMKKITFTIMMCALSVMGAKAQSVKEVIADAIVSAVFGDSKQGKDTPTHKHIDAGGTVSLVLPKNITSLDPSAVTWSPVDSKYVRVRQSNKTSAVIQGLRSTSSTVVNAKYSFKKFKDGKETTVTETFPFTITVNKVDPESVTLPQVTEVGWGVTRGLPLKVTPEFAECNYLFDSSDINTVTVDGNGYLYGVKLGEADVTVKTSNGLTCETHVRCVVPSVSSVEVTGFNKKDRHEVGDELQLSFSHAPEHAIPEVKWSSTDPAIATVDQNGHVKLLDTGTVHIVVTDKTGAKNDVKIKVKKNK